MWFIIERIENPPTTPVSSRASPIRSESSWKPFLEVGLTDYESYDRMVERQEFFSRITASSAMFPATGSRFRNTSEFRRPSNRTPSRSPDTDYANYSRILTKYTAGRP
jgi:hypothetical protein